jgi:hypothetical protein
VAWQVSPCVADPLQVLGRPSITSRHAPHPERLLLFCVASHTEWERAGITGAEVTGMVIKGLIGREPTGQLYLTKQRRAAVLGALPVEEDE